MNIFILLGIFQYIFCCRVDKGFPGHSFYVLVSLGITGYGRQSSEMAPPRWLPLSLESMNTFLPQYSTVYFKVGGLSWVSYAGPVT